MARRGNKPKKQRKNRDKQNANLIPFKKDDPRINRLGRPKTLKELRELVQHIAHGQVSVKSSKTQLEQMLTKMLKGKSAADRKEILRYGWGEVPQEVEHGGKLLIEVEYVHDWRDEADSIAATASRAKDDLEEPSALSVARRGETLAENDPRAASRD